MKKHRRDFKIMALARFLSLCTEKVSQTLEISVYSSPDEHHWKIDFKFEGYDHARPKKTKSCWARRGFYQ